LSSIAAYSKRFILVRQIIDVHYNAGRRKESIPTKDALKTIQHKDPLAACTVKEFFRVPFPLILLRKISGNGTLKNIYSAAVGGGILFIQSRYTIRGIFYAGYSDMPYT
jgi:hypothetical protein